MGTANERQYLLERLPALDLPRSPLVLDVGPAGKSKKKVTPWKDIISRGASFTGVDIVPGEDVDVVHDLSAGLGPFEGSHFDLILCTSVLEHCRAPWLLAASLEMLLPIDGVLYVSVPFVWRYHNYGGDYWRFLPDGVEQLFPGIAWDPPVFSTSRKGEFAPAPVIKDTVAVPRRQDRKQMPVLMLHMIGRKKETS